MYVTCFVGIVGVGSALVEVQAGVAVARKRKSPVIVGTGDRRATCRVASRSFGAPVAAASQMICRRISSSMGGMEEGRVSPL